VNTRRRTVRRPAAPRPRLTWRRWDSILVTIIAGAQNQIVLSTVGGMATLAALGVQGDYTLRRLLGSIAVTSAIGLESNGIDFLTWGVGIIEDDAVAAAAMPDVRTDPFPWLAFGHSYASLQGSFAADVHPLQVYPVESKAMRKVNDNHQSIVMVVEADAQNEGNLVFQTSGRFLVSR